MHFTLCGDCKSVLHGVCSEVNAAAVCMLLLVQEVQRLMCGNSRKQRLDRASLDAVSIHQLQAAVAQFAAQGECMLDSPSR